MSAAAAAAKSLQSCPTPCDPIDGSPPGSLIPGILQARTLEWVAISFSSAWKWQVKRKSLSHVQLLATPWTAAHQAPPSMGFSRKEYWSGLPLPSPVSCLAELIQGCLRYIFVSSMLNLGFPGGASGKESSCQCRRHKRHVQSLLTICYIYLHGLPWWLRWWRVVLPMQETQVPSLGQKIPWRRKWQPTPVFLPGKLDEQRSLAGYSPWGRKESDTTEYTCMHACCI